MQPRRAKYVLEILVNKINHHFPLVNYDLQENETGVTLYFTSMDELLQVQSYLIYFQVRNPHHICLAVKGSTHSKTRPCLHIQFTSLIFNFFD